MNGTIVAVLAFAGILGATLLGMRLRAALPDHHLSAETKETVRLGMGMVVTMTALLLGLLVASAKGSYDTQRAQVIQMSGKIGYLDRVLSQRAGSTVREVGGSHAIYVSNPQAVADIIEEAATRSSKAQAQTS